MEVIIETINLGGGGGGGGGGGLLKLRSLISPLRKISIL